MTPIEVLIEERAISDLLADLADCINRMAVEELRRLFMPDGVWEITRMGSFIGHDEVVGFLGGILAQWDSIIHCVHTGRITLGPGPDQATARWYISESGTKGGVEVRYAGVYHDRYQRTSDGWRFAHRRYDGMYTRVGGEVSVRPFPPDLA